VLDMLFRPSLPSSTNPLSAAVAAANDILESPTRKAGVGWWGAAVA
jgi:hypothetical protein